MLAAVLVLGWDLVLDSTMWLQQESVRARQLQVLRVVRPAQDFRWRWVRLVLAAVLELELERPEVVVVLWAREARLAHWQVES